MTDAPAPVPAPAPAPAPAERFPLPWTVRSNADAYWVEDAAGNRFFFTYVRDRPLVGTTAGAHHSRDAARRLVAQAARLPQLLGAAPKAAGGEGS